MFLLLTKRVYKALLVNTVNKLFYNHFNVRDLNLRPVAGPLHSTFKFNFSLYSNRSKWNGLVFYQI